MADSSSYRFMIDDEYEDILSRANNEMVGATDDLEAKKNISQCLLLQCRLLFRLTVAVESLTDLINNRPA